MSQPTIPRWGRVTAQANEFLIHIRGGSVVRAGQGVSCFKWPSDSVAVVPTSIAKLSFSADQVTVEKVGVEVRGLAVYRIADPLLAYRMIDFDRTSLTEILRDMFVGATRRIVATLTLEECLTHRKDRVGEALVREIAPILAGDAVPSDAESGWGVVLDTIEIQDVRVLSEEVFARLQSPYRQQLALDALLAEDRVKQERAKLEAERRRAEENARRALMDEEEARIAAERRREEAARAHDDAMASLRLEAELERTRRKDDADRERAAKELAARREAGETEAAILRMHRAAHEDLSESRLREIMVTQTMPEIARAFRESFDRVHVTSTDGDAFGFLTAGLDRVLSVVSTEAGVAKKR